MCGSPANAVGLLALRNPDLHLVAGLNLPMVLEVLTSTRADRGRTGRGGHARRPGRRGRRGGRVARSGQRDKPT